MSNKHRLKKYILIPQEEVRIHEQSLVWTMQSILDKLEITGETLQNARAEFVEHLINKIYGSLELW